MNREELLALAREVLRLPTAPYHEQAVREFVVAYCRARGLPVEADRVGNVIVKYQRPQAGTPAPPRGHPPLVFVAHMDHPGFEMLDAKRAEFLGGVPKEMLGRGGKVRIYDSRRHSMVKATIRRFRGAAWPKKKIVELKTEATVHCGDWGVWDLPAFRLSRGRLHAAAIDDVLGSVVMLATLAETARRRLRTHLWCAFTRAEEVGFLGATALIQSRRIPKNALVVSIEMSRERPWARVGDGPIVRVGDRLSIFDPAASAFLLRVAERCRAEEPAFRAQRCLMDGGTCEASAFAGFGYRAGGLCLPLGNYHNIDPGLRPRAEYVSVNDLEQLVRLTVAASKAWPADGAATRLGRQRFVSIARAAPRKLTAL
ncbi:MAG TPA: M20/M25/M40 family metallo-hydrolase [Verrucomicrobiae bacterium]|nr:M20/M25/M40 family metallo-hydrolase [Verrucomicrobiae bacterium]